MSKVVTYLGKMGCVDSETEFLTPSGWKKIKEYNGEEIATYDKNGNMFFETPSNYINLPATEWYEFKTKYGLDQKLSGEHRVVYLTSKDNIYEKKMEDVYKNHMTTVNGFQGRFISSFSYDGNLVLPCSDDYIRLLVAVCADGCRIS